MDASIDRTYPHGVPCWIDTEQPDVDAALAFYGELFGWAFEERMPPGSPVRYVVALLEGQDVAAIASSDDDGPASWSTYVAVDDADAAAAAFAAGGATVLGGPVSAGPAGRLVVVRDPQGATTRLWQPGTRLGSQRVDSPGTWVFSHLVTPDATAALAFYGPLLGWEVSADLGAGMIRVPGYGDHLARTVDPGIHERQKFAPPGFADVVAGVVERPGPPGWEVRIAVEDRDASAAAAERAGATVLASDETEWAREALVRDPQGAELVLSQFAPRGAAQGGPTKETKR